MAISVKFEGERRTAVLSVLDVECPEHPTVQRLLQQLLFDLRVQIVRNEALVGSPRAGWRERLHVVEFDGSRLSAARKGEIVAAIISGLSELSQKTRARPVAAPVFAA